MNSELAVEVGLKEIKGVYLARVMEDGAAGKAGIEDGAVVLQVEGQEVNSTAELMSKIAQHRPGEIVQLSASTR